MFTDEFKKYILIGVSIFIIILMILGSKSFVASISKNSIYNLTIKNMYKNSLLFHNT